MDAVRYWMDELANRSESTRQKYRHFLGMFCEFIGKTPDQIIEGRKRDLRAEDPRHQCRCETAVKAFISYLEEEKGYSVSSLQVAYAAVRSFFEVNYMPLRMRRGDYPSGESLGYRAATREDIDKICKKIPLRTKALIFCLKDSGLRVSDVSKLHYGDISKEIENGSKFIPIRLITKKNSIAARTFVGPETIDILKKYIEKRRKGTRKVPPEEITANSPLFRQRQNFDPISRTGLSSLLNHHVKRAGLYKEISAHSLRKFFQTQLEAAGVHPNWIDQMIGHRLQGVRNHYSRPTDAQLKQVYTKTYSFLRIYPMRVSSKELVEVTKRQQELEKENRELKGVVKALLGRTETLESELSRFDVMGEELMKMLSKGDIVIGGKSLKNTLRKQGH